jgi:DNA repair exonuclease SbcCD ATPase subunit
MSIDDIRARWGSSHPLGAPNSAVRGAQRDVAELLTALSKAEAEAERDEAHRDLDALAAEVGSLRKERDEARATLDERIAVALACFAAELGCQPKSGDIFAAIAALRKERDAETERANLLGQRVDELQRDRDSSKAQLAKVRGDLDTMIAVHDEVERDRDALCAKLAEAEALLHRIVKYAREDRMRTPGKTRLARALIEAGDLLSLASAAPTLDALAQARNEGAAAALRKAAALFRGFSTRNKRRDEYERGLADAWDLAADEADDLATRYAPAQAAPDPLVELDVIVGEEPAETCATCGGDGDIVVGTAAFAPCPKCSGERSGA